MTPRGEGGREHVLETRMVLPLPVEPVFAFFGDAGNLERITPPELRFAILSPRPIHLGVGALIDYRLQLFGVPFRWRTRIDRFEPEVAFVDRQVRGPYRIWVHTHTFRAVPSGTEIRDHVRWALPLPPLGEVAAPLVRRQLDRIFRYRERAIRGILTPGAPDESPAEVRHRISRGPDRALENTQEVERT